MEVTPNTFQHSKNRRRLVIQNIKLHKQVSEVRQQIERLQQQQPIIDEALVDSQIRPVLEQIALQQKLIKKLRGQIEQYKLERAKDNVEYIVKEEDDLKIMKKQQLKLIDEKNIYLSKKADKGVFLQKDVPYQQYEHQFLEKLTEVVHHNRQQASKITEIERQIRKYHLLKKSKTTPQAKTVSPEEITALSQQIEQQTQAKANLERQWKPHFNQLDEQYASLLRLASIKKQELAELERQEKNWQTRVSAIRQAEDVVSDKHRLEQVSVSAKLKKQIEDYIASEEEKKKKKVNDRQLLNQFMSKKTKEKDKQEEQSNKPLGAPPLPGQKKLEDKIMETMHNDKNITKKIEKGSPKKTTKSHQISNTQITIPPKAEKISKLRRADSVASSVEKKPLASQEKVTRLWQMIPEEPIQERKALVKQGDKGGGVLHLKEVSIVTEKVDWNE